MHVTILRSLGLTDAGRLRALDAGQAYDLPDVVASRLIARGVAVLDEPALRVAGPREAAVTGPHESSGRRRRR